MRIAYLDCFAGISGDMFLGALLDAGVPPSTLHEAVAALKLGASLQIEKVDRSGISSTKVHVLENGHLAEDHPHEHSHEQEHSHEHENSHTYAGEHAPAEVSATQSPLEQDRHRHEHQHQPRTQHLHKAGHTHEHPHTHEHAHTHEHPHTDEHAVAEPHAHTHGRSLTVIRDLIRSASLAEPVKSLAIHTFELLGASEAKIHNVPVEQIHFHEVGAVDAIVDIVAASAGIHFLHQGSEDQTGVQTGAQTEVQTGETLRWHASPLNVGGGTVQCAHGNFPVPAPATADLLRGLPTYSAHLQKELVTPTGAALIRALNPAFGPQPPMSVSHIGYGAGTRNPKDFPNVLRLSLGESTSISAPAALPTAVATPARELHTHGYPVSFGTGMHGHAPHAELVTILETAIDDLSPQILAHVTEQALALGALDVMTTAVGMKKGRPGTLLTILTDEEHSPALERLLLRETSTLGIRVQQQRRISLGRHHTSVPTPFGEIRIKIGSFDSEVLNAAPEFEDCRAAALAHNVPVKQVMQAATAAYVNQQGNEAAPTES